MSRSSLRPALKAHQHTPAGVAAAWTPEELTTSLWLDASDEETVTSGGGPGGTYSTAWTEFDGVDDIASAASAWDALPPSAYSVSFWCKLPASLTGIDDFDSLVNMHGDTTSGSSHRFRAAIKADGALRYYEGDAAPSGYASGTLATDPGVCPTDGAWHHWCYTSQGTASGTMKIYIDGSEVASGANGVALDASPRALNLWVGANASWGSRRTLCSIDEVLIYSSLLPATGDVSVAALYNGGNGPAAPPTTGLINHLRMGDGTGDSASTLVDVVGNQDLTLANGPTIEYPAVSQWDDKSSNSRHLSQASASLQPSISGGAISTDSTTYLFRTDTWLYAAGSMSLFIVGAGAAQSDLRIISESTSTHPSASCHYMIETGPGSDDSKLCMIIKNTSGSELLGHGNLSADNAFDGTTKILYWEDSGSVATGRVNGNAGIDRAYTRSGTLTMDRFALGGLLRNVFSHGFTGSFKEIITATVLSTADRQKVEGYLAHKHSLTASLPADHPFKNEAPTV
jgi:hypothetical protein